MDLGPDPAFQNYAGPDPQARLNGNALSLVTLLPNLFSMLFFLFMNVPLLAY